MFTAVHNCWCHISTVIIVGSFVRDAVKCLFITSDTECLLCREVVFVQCVWWWMASLWNVYVCAYNICKARHFMQLHILQRKSPFLPSNFSFCLFCQATKFSRKFEKWSWCNWCKSAIKHKVRLNFDTFFFSKTSS